MSCLQQAIAGIQNDCLGARGGIKHVAIALYKEGAITANTETHKADESAELDWKHFYVRPNSSNFTQALTKDAANGISYVTQTVNLVFTRMDTVKKIEMNALINANLTVACQDAQGLWWICGYDAPATCTAGTGDSGTAVGDGSKYTCALTAESEWYMNEASPELSAKLTALVNG